MRNALVCGVVLLALAASAATNMQAQEVQGAHQTDVALQATLRGGDVLTAAFGNADMVFNPNTGWVDCDITVWNAPDSVVAAHLHLGGPGVNGPVLVPFDVTAFSGDAMFSCDFNLTDVIPQPTYGLMNGDDLGEAFTNGVGNTYVNIHTSGNPGGEIRGQVWMK